jgi:hypothetical protein
MCPFQIWMYPGRNKHNEGSGEGLDRDIVLLLWRDPAARDK